MNSLVFRVKIRIMVLGWLVVIMWCSFLWLIKCQVIKRISLVIVGIGMNLISGVKSKRIKVRNMLVKIFVSGVCVLFLVLMLECVKELEFV